MFAQLRNWLLAVLKCLIGTRGPQRSDGILTSIAQPDPFTYRRAVEEHAFIQVPLLDAPQFIADCVRRGLPEFDEAALEGLDREGLLPPIGFRLNGRLTGAQKPRCFRRVGSICVRTSSCRGRNCVPVTA